MVDPIHLAQATYHWLKYQKLCGRSELFCEAYLSQPIGEYCLSLGPEHFEAECNFPHVYQKGTKRRRALDFAVFGPSTTGHQKVMKDAIETKFINARRTFTQEIYDDLFRLLWFQPTREPDGCRRWLVVAGYKKNIDGDKFLDDKVQLGRGRGKPQRAAFTGLLSIDLNNHTREKPMHTATPELRALWVSAAKSFGQKEIPNSIAVRLAGRAPSNPRPAEPCCYVWEVLRPQPDFASVHPV
jgi:hypothetical protein